MLVVRLDITYPDLRIRFSSWDDGPETAKCAGGRWTRRSTSRHGGCVRLGGTYVGPAIFESFGGRHAFGSLLDVPVVGSGYGRSHGGALGGGVVGRSSCFLDIIYCSSGLALGEEHMHGGHFRCNETQGRTFAPADDAKTGRST